MQARSLPSWKCFRNGDLDNYVSWIERRGRGVFLEACPIDVSGILAERLFTRVPTCVLTSATLTVADSFSYIRERLGFNKGENWRSATEFDIHKQALLYVPRGMPDYRQPAYAGRAAEEIRAILNASDGRAFVLFTSYKQMETLYEMLAHDLPFPVSDSGER